MITSIRAQHRGAGITVSLLAVLLIITFAPVVPAQGQDFEQAFREGRRAFYAGDLDTAHANLSVVLAAHPNHYASKVLMAQVQARLDSDPGRALQRRVSQVVIDKIDFDEAELSIALDFLSKRTAASTDDEFEPSFILRGEGTGDRQVSLQLRNVPLDQVLEYLGQMTGVAFRYEQFAIVGAPVAGVAEPAAEPEAAAGSARGATASE